ncbi:ectoine/hydroxyectoine ABC transporter permease subunit EhuD [Salicibibacter cibarius]|uniref:Ectoine/hydroxyectoine ABC transporter permease subunit EhuD n=1 Tax=Salicibibacter cibarius TaxID=2743000 RepID=A0A7T6Z201_9BACI|nr:ectoine/hydroxyectoine ABC transporter permease subunit EhuD [Salicibibacter cibarius]QQK75523.1 ectoine/hydroxyectoine ABC transporter permease subunit EhuD [Salicibibacter cibarius]
MTWDWEFAFEIFPDILNAIGVTIGATVAAYFISLTLGLVLTLLRRSSFKPLSLFVAGVIEFIRMTPPLVQLFFVYFAFDMSPFLTGAIVLGVHYATYVSEVYRSGIESVPASQWEASKALNFSTAHTWQKVILPQAIPPVIPMLGNYLIVLFKETPLLSGIYVLEMLAVAQMIGSDTYRFLEPVTIVGFLFLVLSYPSALFIRYLEKRSGQMPGSSEKGVKT